MKIIDINVTKIKWNLWFQLDEIDTIHTDTDTKYTQFIEMVEDEEYLWYRIVYKRSSTGWSIGTTTATASI